MDLTEPEFGSRNFGKAPEVDTAQSIFFFSVTLGNQTWEKFLSGKPLTIPVVRVLRKFIRREKSTVEMLLGHEWVGVKQYEARAKAMERHCSG